MRGITSGMRPEHQGEHAIPKKLKYQDPAQPDKDLSTETQNLYFYSESDYRNVNENLEVLNRKALAVS